VQIQGGILAIVSNSRGLCLLIRCRFANLLLLVIGS